jgi:hypothetical protein
LRQQGADIGLASLYNVEHNIMATSMKIHYHNLIDGYGFVEFSKISLMRNVFGF